MKTSYALKTGAAAALALSLVAGNAWAAASCARPQDIKALQAAALQQQLMVAALTCHATADYNRFVTSYRSELLESDHALMNFFLRQDAHKGADGYNAYKTRLANDASLGSLHDPRFCRSAKIAFDVALKRKGSLTELTSERPSLIDTGYTSCMPGAPETTQMADATPSLPARHQICRTACLPPPSSSQNWPRARIALCLQFRRNAMPRFQRHRARRKPPCWRTRRPASRRGTRLCRTASLPLPSSPLNRLRAWIALCL